MFGDVPALNTLTDTTKSSTIFPYLAAQHVIQLLQLVIHSIGDLLLDLVHESTSFTHEIQTELALAHGQCVGTQRTKQQHGGLQFGDLI